MILTRFEELVTLYGENIEKIFLWWWFVNIFWLFLDRMPFYSLYILPFLLIKKTLKKTQTNTRHTRKRKVGKIKNKTWKKKKEKKILKRNYCHLYKWLSIEICSQANYLNREELVVATFDLSSPKLPPSTKSRFSFAPQGEQNKVRNQASSALQENKFLSLFF